MRDIVEIDYRIPDVGGRLDQAEYEAICGAESHYNANVGDEQIRSEVMKTQKRSNERKRLLYEIYNWASNKSG